MDKEELKALIDSLTIGEIESFEITYKRKKDYGMYYDSKNINQTISYNKEGK